MRWLLVLIVIALAACEPIQTTQSIPQRQDLSRGEVRALAQRAAQQFVSVVDRVEPVAEEECRRATRGVNCDYQIVVDDTPGEAPNAFQTVDANGRPILAFNLALILSAQNADELAFVMGHEASHHIAGHLGRAQQNAAVGALIFSGLAALGGGSADAVRNAEQMGASLGARSFSKEFELEADRLGTVIAIRAGFDPVRGAEFFTRLPDPGDKFLGTHPPNAARIEAVRRTAAAL
ncbi:M48 family metallopeptidase [Mesobacterium sp. TK19101]|uniref:M48 family metallopeptidase n=1 Tax=Mesobacterium hydrothermale TaxID=3111907 RepID=A0ABU6HH56_9RHOB|nr:M48 family metallopeptidase [Mesobacterium sp. TK19101]MEC3861261.1 M48 family metallopeptidase [Mesobacterium sp. TK19101]